MSHDKFTKPCVCSTFIGHFSSSHSEALGFRSSIETDSSFIFVTKMASDSKSPDVIQSSPFEMQVMACLKELKTDMQSMSDRLERVEDSAGPARRAQMDHVTFPRQSPAKSWGKRMEEEDPIENSLMEVNEDDIDAKGIRLFPVSDWTESFLRPIFSPFANPARRQLRDRYGLPNVPCTAFPHLDKVLKPMLPAPTKTRDTELARVQSLALDAFGPLVRIVEDAQNGQLTAERTVEAVQTSLRLLGNLSANCNRMRRTTALKSLNPRIVDMADEDSLYCDAGLNLFGDGFCRKVKERDEELKALNHLGTSGSGVARKNQRSFFPR